MTWSGHSIAMQILLVYASHIPGLFRLAVALYLLLVEVDDNFRKAAPASKYIYNIQEVYILWEPADIAPNCCRSQRIFNQAHSNCL